MPYKPYNKPNSKSPTHLEYKRYRVKSPVKTFRDLEVYKNTTQLAVEIFRLSIPKQPKKIEKEFEILTELAKPIPKLIAEANGDKFSNLSHALNKLEQSMQITSDVIAKIDFLIASVDDQKTKESLNDILKRYQAQSRKILNLKTAWKRVFGRQIMLFDQHDQTEQKIPVKCPYCSGKDFIKSGKRQKKFEVSQVYFCKRCDKKFTISLTKHKTFPLRIILDSVIFYNRLYTLDESAQKVSERYGIKVTAQNIALWLKAFQEYLPFLKMRGFIKKQYKKTDSIVESKMFHGQVYDFRYHRAKTGVLLQADFKHYKFRPLQEFLELVIAECPHQIFRESTKRASEYRDVLNTDQVKIVPKDNLAVKKLSIHSSGRC